MRLAQSQLDPCRQGMSLLEVLAAMTIFLFSLVVIGRLINLSADHASAVQQQSEATVRCQSKLAEVVAGVYPLSSQGETPFDEDPNWVWSMDCEQASIVNLWNVTVTVHRATSTGESAPIECVLHQMVLDPSVKGSVADITALATAVSTANSTANSAASSASSSGTTTGAAATPRTTTPTAAPAATPTTGKTPAATTPKAGSSSAKGK